MPPHTTDNQPIPHLAVVTGLTEHQLRCVLAQISHQIPLAAGRARAPVRRAAESTIGIIRDHRYQAHRLIGARVEHIIARLKDWRILRRYRHRGNAINHSLRIVTGLWNLKSRRQLRGQLVLQESVSRSV